MAHQNDRQRFWSQSSVAVFDFFFFLQKWKCFRRFGRWQLVREPLKHSTLGGDTKQEWITSYLLKICPLLLTTIQMATQRSSNCNSWCLLTAVRRSRNLANASYQISMRFAVISMISITSSSFVTWLSPNIHLAYIPFPSSEALQFDNWFLHFIYFVYLLNGFPLLQRWVAIL